MVRISIIASFCLALLPASGMAAAAELSIDPPPGHSVEKAAADGSYTQDLSVQSKVDADAGCEAAFQPTSAIGVTQDMLNKVAATPAFVETVKNFVGLKFDITKAEPYALGDVKGVQVEGTAKGSPEVWSLTTILQTPKGRTNVSCVGPKVKAEALRPEFGAILQGVKPPR